MGGLAQCLAGFDGSLPKKNAAAATSEVSGAMTARRDEAPIALVTAAVTDYNCARCCPSSASPVLAPQPLTTTECVPDRNKALPRESFQSVLLSVNIVHGHPCYKGVCKAGNERNGSRQVNVDDRIAALAGRDPRSAEYPPTSL